MPTKIVPVAVSALYARVPPKLDAFSAGENWPAVPDVRSQARKVKLAVPVKPLAGTKRIL